ncbi:hypothetical protein AUP74_03181 [Microbulbifer aggregans]|uniref:FimV N-terminal domain-containing protein n=1 Tax=Microbulbifer aggregans TaxID=1769779 RepID=A0A1C9WBP7_9GAMM|nr:FimV/HubP family polar landmark protein [Microbulbifer aggregans]AOS98547.1 hypothetical protein AUP74_03181 [Microbulbifer aggregans]
MDLRHTLPIHSRPVSLLAFILQIPLILASAPTLALGLGNASLKTTLGYPLAVEIPILDRSASLDVSQVRVRQVVGIDAKQMGYDLAATALPLSIDVSEMSSGLTIQVKSPAPLNEPFVSFVLELSWPGGTLYRDYDLLLDPPPIAPPTAATAPTNPASPATQAPGTSPAPGNLTYAGKQWRVAPGDSLWRIARQLQPDISIPLDAVMAAIHARNPHAFLNGDMNRLQAGALLDLPGANDYSAPPVAAAPSPAGREPSSRSMNTASSVVQSNETAQGRLRLSGSPAGNSGSRTVHPREEIDAIKEQIDKVNRENEQLRQQIQRIEASDYMAVMQEMLQLQEQRIEELKAQMRNDASTRAGADSTAITPDTISNATPPAVPAPVIIRDAGPSFTALLLLALAAFAVGVALSQLRDWWLKRRTATEAPAENQILNLDSLTSHWGGEAPPPAPEADSAEAEEGEMTVSVSQDKGQENAGDPAPPRTGSSIEEPQLDEAISQGPSDLPASGAAEAGNTENKRVISGMAAADKEEKNQGSAGSPAILSPESLFEDLQLDESFAEDSVDLATPNSHSINKDLVLEFDAIDLFPLAEIDLAATRPEPDVDGNADADDKMAIKEAAI